MSWNFKSGEFFVGRTFKRSSESPQRFSLLPDFRDPTPKSLARLAVACAAFVWFALVSSQHANAQIRFEQAPIDYINAEVNDPVARLAQKVAAGEAELEFEEHFGYLRSVLAELEIPIESQSLVFSKTSLQLRRISPRRPRALYFNDDVYVGFCQQGDVLEFASTDANQGAIFYTLKQDEDTPPTFVRDRGSCLTCHASNRTQGVPGYLVRSVFPDASGRPRLGSGTFTTDQTSDFADRWGGWYVTGKHGSMRHMGNTIAKRDDRELDRESGANLSDLSTHFRTEAYLTPHSDMVALMVLEHQTQMHNAICAANYETRLALEQSFQMNELLDRPKGHISDSANRRIDTAAKNVVQHLLMCDEFQLTSQVEGTSGFAERFPELGPTDSRGRSLRELDLATRLFKYPCSYLIYSDAFNAMPDEVRSRVLARLASILTGTSDSEEFEHLTPDLCKAIVQILSDTKPEFANAVLRAYVDRK